MRLILRYWEMKTMPNPHGRLEEAMRHYHAGVLQEPKREDIILVAGGKDRIIKTLEEQISRGLITGARITAVLEIDPAFPGSIVKVTTY